MNRDVVSGAVQSDFPIRVMVLEDVPKTRAALVALLDGSSGFACVGACETVESALRQIPRLNPELILVDLELPGI